MGKHSSSSSSSSSSDEESKHISKEEKKQRKKWKKQMKKGLIPPGSVPPWKQGGKHGHAPQGVPCGAPSQGVPGGAYGADPSGLHYGAPSAIPGQPLPPQVAYPASAGYVVEGQPQGYPAPAQGYPAPGQGYPAPGQGYPAPGQGQGYPAPGQGQGYPAPVVGAPGQGGPAPPGPVAVLDPSMGSTTHSPGMVPPGAQPPSGGVEGLGQQMQQVQLDGCAELFRPTVRPAPNFSAEKDCEALRHSMKGAGTDERTIVGIIGQRSNYQRQEIAKFYKTMFGRDIIQDLESDLSGNFRETIMALFKAPSYYDAWSLHNAMQGAGTKEGVLIEILCTRTNHQIKDIVACYKKHFKRDLEQDIISDTSGHFKKLLVSCSQGNRQELTPQQLQQIRTQGPAAVVDVNLAREDAAKLHQAGVKRLGTDESAFIMVLALRNMYQLQATFEEYQKLAGKDLLSAISSETSGDFETGLRAIVRSAKNRPEYFADKLHDCVKGMGTNDSRLIRIVVSRSEIDLQDIKDVYLSKYKKTLESAVASDTSGDYKRLLLGIIGH
ncbi:annexin-B12-like isoform X2 [Babylonia areolata]|uniref:annexin-B12-like isoform X2 n=1 Tax=Babylonia areolata TaxID=304850 RepID=UPI003FD41B93